MDSIQLALQLLLLQALTAFMGKRVILNHRQEASTRALPQQCISQPRLMPGAARWQPRGSLPPKCLQGQEEACIWKEATSGERGAKDKKNITDVFESLNKHLQIKEHRAKVANSSGKGKQRW